MAERKDVILLNQEWGDIEIYPLAHKDNYEQVIYDTYSRKEIDTFSIAQNKWYEEGNYFVCDLTKEDYEELQYVKETDAPVWDIRVNPIEDTEIAYKTQIKNRAYITTLITGDGTIKLVGMKAPDTDVILILKGLDLHERS